MPRLLTFDVSIQVGARISIQVVIYYVHASDVCVEVFWRTPNQKDVCGFREQGSRNNFMAVGFQRLYLLDKHAVYWSNNKRANAVCVY